MGLNSSKAHPKVTKVAPMTRKEDKFLHPGSVAVYTFQSPLRETTATSFASRMDRNPALERHLPPLREVGLGRQPTVPVPVPPDLTMDAGEASIIKQHPPRRPQKLEPFILTKDFPPDKFLSLQGGTAACNAKELDKGRQAGIHPTGRRQYLLKMKMLEKRKEAELKSCLHQEARLNKPKRRDLNINETLGCVQRNNSSDDEEPLALEQDRMFAGDQRHWWTEEFLEEHRPPESHLSQRSKVETWLLKHQARRDSSWDASSTDSDNWKPCRRPALVRTKTERISLFDDFFDKEF